MRSRILIEGLGVGVDYQLKLGSNFVASAAGSRNVRLTHALVTGKPMRCIVGRSPGLEFFRKERRLLSAA